MFNSSGKVWAISYLKLFADDFEFLFSNKPEWISTSGPRSNFDQFHEVNFLSRFSIFMDLTISLCLSLSQWIFRENHAVQDYFFQAMQSNTQIQITDTRVLNF